MTTPNPGDLVLIEAETISGMLGGRRFRTICPADAVTRSVAYFDLDQVNWSEATKLQPSLVVVRAACWGDQAWMHGHQCIGLAYGEGDVPPNWCDHCSADVPRDQWDRVYRSTGDPHTGQSEATASGTGSTLPAQEADSAPSDADDAQAPTEQLPPPCGLTWEHGECVQADLHTRALIGLHTCALIGGHRTHRCVCGASWSSDFAIPEDVEAGKPDATEQLFADFTTEWLAAGDDAERTEALEDLLDGWYTNWPATAVTSAHWPIADRLVQMLGPWNGTTMVDSDDATDDLWLIVAEVLAKGGLDAAMFEDDAREILRRLGWGMVRRQAAMLPAVLLWRDHTAAVLATLLDELDRTTVDSTHELLTAIATAREVLTVDPVQTYGSAGPLPDTNLRTLHWLRHDLATSEERRGRQARIIAGQVSLIANVWALTAAKTDHDVVSVELLRKALRDSPPATNPEPEELTDDELDVACAIEYLVRHGQPLNARGVRRLQGERDLARQSAEREATNAEQLRQHFDKASRERDSWKQLAEGRFERLSHSVNRSERLRHERDEAQASALALVKAVRTRDDRIAALASVEPTQAEYGAAQTAILDAWPHLAGDAFVDQVAIIAVDAAWKLNGAPRAEDTDPEQVGQAEAGTDGV